jgi:Fic family protein
VDAASARAGRLIQQVTGYRAFIPAPLPPDPPIAFDTELVGLLADASVAVGRLDGVARMLPNPNLFVAMYVRREAVLSSQIEGTQSTLDDVLSYELDDGGPDVPPDVTEVVNYVHALNHGLTRLPDLPLSLRLLREIHAVLLEGTRGGEKAPGEFRTTQNWIGAPGPRGLDDATYVPPPPAEMMAALDNFERFLHDTSVGHPLITCGVAHAQFETIHPFLDGNGRIGRLLITFLLCHAGVLRQPLLYLSHYLRLNRTEYYDRLMAVRRSGDWEGWMRFFLRGVRQVADEAEATAGHILDVREQCREIVRNESLTSIAYGILDLLFDRPIITVNFAASALGTSFVTANNLINRLCEVGILVETTGGKRNRRFRFDRYLALFSEPERQPVAALTSKTRT